MSEPDVRPERPAAPPPRKGVSLWTDAWRRLRKNHMAMIGLWVTAFMGFTATFAPQLAPFDADYGETWIGATEPGFAHATVLNRSFLVVGEPAGVPPEQRTARSLRFTVDEGIGAEEEVQVRLIDGEVRSILRTQGARPVASVDAGPPGHYLIEVATDGNRLEPPLRGVRLAAGERAPAALAARSSGTYVFRHGVHRSPSTYEAILRDGVVVRLTRDARPIDRVELEGRAVRTVAGDGRLCTHRHLLGTDLMGRDLLSRILFGARISLLIGIVATVVSLVIGVVYGAVSGYIGRRLDDAMMAIVDILFGIPYMFLVILLLVNFGRSIIMLFIALGCVQWLTMARIVRGQILSLKEKEFIEAARMSGTGTWGIVFRHLIPNTLGVVVVYTTVTVPTVILQESFLAFIGLTVTYDDRTLDSWGALVKFGVDALGNDGSRWWLLVYPSIAMAATLFSLNFLGDGLRDALDPQLRGRT